MAAAIGGVSAGFGKGQGGFNFKRGLMGGMTAYGLSNLYAGLQSAALSGQTPLPSDVAAASQANSSNVANLATLEAGPQAGMFEAAAQPSMGSNIMAGNFSDAATQFGDKATMMGKVSVANMVIFLVLASLILVFSHTIIWLPLCRGRGGAAAQVSPVVNESDKQPLT
jgi:hypothetical protein